MATPDDKVGLQLGNIQRHGAKMLNGVDHQQRAIGPACGAEPLQVEPNAAVVAHRADCNDSRFRIQRSDQCTFRIVRVEWHHAALDEFGRQLLPWHQVAGKFSLGADHCIAGPPVEAGGDQAKAIRCILDQSQVVGIGSEQATGALAQALLGLQPR